MESQIDINKRLGQKIRCPQCGREFYLRECDIEKVGNDTYVIYCESGCEFILDQKIN